MKPRPTPSPPGHAAPPAAPRAQVPAGLQHTLTYRLHKLHKLTDLESQRQYPVITGLSLSDGRCLAAVGSFEPVSVNDLARYANLTKSQASRAAQSLEQRGLLRKEMRSSDARSVDLTLTEAGRAAWHKAMALIERRNEEIFGCLSPPEQAQLGAMLDRLLAHADAREGGT